MKDGTRFSTQRAYVYPASRRPNLTIRPYSTATKVFFITISCFAKQIKVCDSFRLNSMLVIVFLELTTRQLNLMDLVLCDLHQSTEK